MPDEVKLKTNRPSRVRARVLACAMLSVFGVSQSLHAQNGVKPQPAPASDKTQATPASDKNGSAPASDKSPSVPASDKTQKATPSEATSEPVVRARRVSGEENSAAPVGVGDAATKYASPSKDETAKTATATETTDETLEDLRAQMSEARSDVERARLRRAFVERLMTLNRHSEALDELRDMMRAEVFDPVLFYNIGNAFARLGDSHNAVEAYRKAISQRRGYYSRAQNNLGVVLLRLGRREEAAEAFAAALKLENGNYSEASYNMGRIHALKGEPELAIRQWMHALYLDPAHTEAAQALARALAESGQYLRALEVLDSFTARLNARGASVPRAISITRGEIVAASNVVEEKIKN